MYTKEIAAQYKIDQKELENFILNSDLNYKSTLFNGIEVFEEAQTVVSQYREYAIIKKERDLQKEEEVRQENELEEQKKAEKEAVKKELEEMITTSTSVLQGYKVIEYCGIVYKTEKFDNLASALTLPLLLKTTLTYLKASTMNLGGNALIGLNISTTKVDARTLLIAYGTAVKIKEDK